MAALGQKLIALDGMNLDVAKQYLKETQARYIKNLYYQLSDLGNAGNNTGANTGVSKPLPSNEIYVPVTLPDGDSHIIGVLPSRETNECYVFAYNSLGNHFIFRINGLARTIDAGAPNPCFNFKLQPEYFIGEGQCYLEVNYVTNPDTQTQETKKDVYWTDGFNYQGYLRFEDYLLTNGFDQNTFSYFNGNYDKCPMVRMGLPTPNDCIQIDEVPFISTDTVKNDNLKFSTWQFRVLFTDVFGRPSEHGMISDLFYLTNNNCLGQSDMLSRCVNLTFDAGNPLIDKITIEYRNCNDVQWYVDSVLDLYNGSNLGEWWLRGRNEDVTYNATNNKVTYQFCKDKLCDPIDPNETNRLEPGLARTSQGVSKVGNEIALTNNKYGFPAFNKKNVLDKLSVLVENPVPSQVGDTANITIWIRIYNNYIFNYQKVWRKDNAYCFGGIRYNKIIPNIITDYQQSFVLDGQNNFFMYLVGTNNYALGVQYYLDDSNNFVKDTDFTTEIDRQYFQKFEFTGVPKGNYIATLASHLADPNVVDIRTTSEYVSGIYNFSNFTVGTIKSIYKELKINVCDSDYDTLTSGEMLITLDMTRPIKNDLNDDIHSDVTLFDGYVYEGYDAINQKYVKPIELLQLSVDSPHHSNLNSGITDRNGFYFAGSIGNPITVRMIGYCDCLKKEIYRASSGGLHIRYQSNMVIGSALPPQPTGFDYHSSCLDYETSVCSRVLIKGTVKLCGSGTGVPNINVVLTRGGIATTDADGNFTIIAHDDIIAGSRVDDIYVMGGSCAFTSCEGTCIEIKSVSFSPCTSCIERDLTVDGYEVLFISNRGLLSNGRYGVQLTGYDWLGRRGFAQTTDNLYFNTPSLNVLKTFGFPTISLIIPSDVTFDSWISYLTVGITAELNYGGNYITWIADKVTFVDNSGEENLIAPTQIRIDYSSLNEYNAKNNFNTTTGWVITPEGTTSPRTADIVQFIKNGDGLWFDNPITALVKYDQEGSYFLINYTDTLKYLKQNALIRLANTQDCTNKDQFFELCGKIPVINGHAQTSKITLNAFDTYYQYRQIPVPVTQTVNTGNPPTPVTSTIIELRQFGFPFESPSVTDTWGYKCWNIGRFNVKNSYENELIEIDEIALSGSLSVNKQLNYLNYFDDKNKYSPIINNSGGITYIRPKTGIVLVVCQYVNYTIGFNDNIPTTDENGNLIIPSASNKFGNPYRDSVAQYGCQLFDKSTIREKNGLVQWLDRSKVAVLQHDYSQCIDVARYNKADSTIISWLTKKIKFQNEYNKVNDGKRYFHSVINPLNFAWLLSEFTIGGNQFVNQERGENVEVQETISFDTIYKVWQMFVSPTPEMFGYLDNTSNGQILFSFKNGVTYSHTANTFNTFFGVACEAIYRFIFNTNGFDKKKFQAMNIYCAEKILWSDLVQTEKQISRLLKEYFRKHDYFYSASFLCDLNSNADPNIPDQTGKNVLTDGDNMFGSYIEVRLIADADGQYFELYGVAETAAKDEQSG